MMHAMHCIPPDSKGEGGRCLCVHAPLSLLGRLVGDIAAGYRDGDAERAAAAAADLVEYVSTLRAQATRLESSAIPSLSTKE